MTFDEYLSSLLVSMVVRACGSTPVVRPHNDAPSLFVAEIDGPVYYSGVGRSPSLALESLLVALRR